MLLSYTHKNVEPVLCPVPRVEALASPYLSDRATLKAPRRCIYHIPPHDGYNNYTPKGRSRCFVFDR